MIRPCMSGTGGILPVHADVTLPLLSRRMVALQPEHAQA
ncbi:secreted protein [marine sediment metagenome]|uniref:Secreted protein n=1 Tax=marine sediment metagenome TaxID=412755 RepID=A0A1B6NPR9_9ZZZZ